MRQQGSTASWVSVNQILDDLRELLNVHPSKGSNRLKIQAVAENVELQINGTDLIQILLNLAINALQSTPTPHAVDILGKVLHAPVDAALLREGPHERVLNSDGFKNAAPILHLSVWDDGPGIPPDVMAKLFKPYFTTKAPGKGTGLGLAIVQRLLKEAHGCLHLQSKPGEGTRFNIYLPAFVKR
jgi:signal transduction histidine kinase